MFIPRIHCPIRELILQSLDCGEARFTALGQISHLRQVPIPSPSRMNPELPGTPDTDVGTCQPLKAAMARRSPKRLDMDSPYAADQNHRSLAGPMLIGRDARMWLLPLTG